MSSTSGRDPNRRAACSASKGIKTLSAGCIRKVPLAHLVQGSNESLSVLEREAILVGMYWGLTQKRICA